MIENMNQPGTPEWWFASLAARLAERNKRISRLEAYMNGDAPLPEAYQGLREVYREFQHKARTNFAEIIVEAVQERMTPAGFTVEGAEGLDRIARGIWSRNELDVFAPDVHTDMLAYSVGYVIVGPSDDGAIITPEDPRLVITAQDPLRPTRTIAALKMFRDPEAGLDVAYLYLPGSVLRASRPVTAGELQPDIAGFDWEYASTLPEPVVPVVRFHNRRGLGEFETHTDLLDRINYMILQRILTVALQTFRQRAVLGDIPETDEDGNPIDFAALFKPGIGAVWQVPEGQEIWESATTDIRPLLDGTEDDVQHLAACTRTPMSMLLPESQNQSAEGAAFAKEGLVFKAKDRQRRASCGWNEAMRLALIFEGHEPANIDTIWLPAERLSLAERADAASKASDIPFRTKMSKIWGFSPEEIERMEAERLSDALAAGLTFGEGR